VLYAGRRVSFSRFSPIDSKSPQPSMLKATDSTLPSLTYSTVLKKKEDLKTFI
jgi:hypothetical protein